MLHNDNGIVMHSRRENTFRMTLVAAEIEAARGMQRPQEEAPKTATSLQRGARSQRGAILRAERLDHFAQKYVDSLSNDLATEQILVFAIQIADQPAGLGNEQTACGHVPWVEADFPKAIVIARGDISEVERGRTGTANSCGRGHHRAHHRDVSFEIASVAKKSGADQAILQIFGGAKRAFDDRSEKRRGPRCGEEIVVHRIVNRLA